MRYIKSFSALLLCSYFSINSMNPDEVDPEESTGFFSNIGRAFSSAVSISKQLYSAFEIGMDPEIARNDPLKVTRMISKYVNTGLHYTKTIAHPALEEFLAATKDGENDDEFESNKTLQACFGPNAKRILTEVVEQVLGRNIHLEAPKEIIIQGNTFKDLPVEIFYVTQLFSRLTFDDASSPTGLRMWDDAGLKLLYDAWIQDIEVSLIKKIKHYQDFVSHLTIENGGIEVMKRKIEQTHSHLYEVNVDISSESNPQQDAAAAAASSERPASTQTAATAFVPPPPPPPLPTFLSQKPQKEAALVMRAAGKREESSVQQQGRPQGAALSAEDLKGVTLRHVDADEALKEKKKSGFHDSIFHAMLQSPKFKSLAKQQRKEED